MINQSLYCQFASIDDASHTDSRLNSERRRERKKEKKTTLDFLFFYTFFLLFVWCLLACFFLPIQPTKELRKLLIIYGCMRLVFGLHSKTFFPNHNISITKHKSRLMLSSKNHSQSSSGNCCCLNFTTSFLFHPNKKILLSQFSSHTETQFSFSYFVQSSTVNGTDNVALR